MASTLPELGTISADLHSSGFVTDPSATGWRAPTVRELILLLLSALAIIFARAPRLLLEGHVVAEEGTTYLRYGWNAAPLRALIAPHQGYYSLLDNGIALIAARLLPLSVTALFFTWTALAVQLLLIFLVIEWEVLRTPLQRSLAVLALLLVTPSFETWLNLENCQSLLVVAAAVIMVSSTTRLFTLRAATVALAGLTSVTPAPLVPLFWWRALRDRSKRAYALAAILSAAALLQAAVVIISLRNGDRKVTPHHWRDLIAFGLSRVFFLPVATSRGAWAYDDFVFAHPGARTMLVLVALSAALVACGWLLFRNTSRSALALYGAALLSIAFSWYGCATCTLSGLPGWPVREGRYFFPANSMLLLALLLATLRPTSRWRARAAGALFIWLLVSGGAHYVRTASLLLIYPAWLPQVHAWQQDPTRPIYAAPEFWHEHPLYLPREHRNRKDIPFGGYDSSTLHPIQD